MKKTINFRKKATLLAVVALTSTCFFAGNYNTAYAEKGKVIGGISTGTTANTATGEDSTVSGGISNTASGYISSVSGGAANTASGWQSSISGGNDNTAPGNFSSVSGGAGNTSSGVSASISGGNANTASGDYASASGGYKNTALGNYASVSGGYGNMASGGYSSVSGGLENTASGIHSSVNGGSFNTAYGVKSLALGGINSIVQGQSSVGMAGGSTGKDANYSVAIGNGSTANASNSIAIGSQSVASEENTISFGHKKDDISYSKIQWQEAKDADGNTIKDSQGNVVYDYSKEPTITSNTYGSDSYNRLVNVADGKDDHDVATVGQLNKAVANISSTGFSGDMNNKKITNLGSGSISENSSDAVNGRDVYEYVKNHANGGVEIDDNGNSVINKNLTVNGDTNLQNTTINQKLTVNGDTDLQNTTVNKNFTVKGDTTLEQTTVNKDLTVNGYTTLKDVTTNNVVVNNDLNVNGTTSLQTLNVQGNSQFNQNIAVAGSAVVGHDLAVGGTVSANRVVADDAIIGGESILHRFDEQRNDIDRVGAGAAALAALQYLPYEDGSKLVAGAGYGHYRGRNAGAVGLRYYPNRDVAFSMASTVGNGDTMLNAGVSFRIGSGTGSIHSSADPQKVIQETKALNKALEDRLNKVENELKELRESKEARESSEIKELKDINKELMKRIEALEAKR